MLGKPVYSNCSRSSKVVKCLEKVVVVFGLKQVQRNMKKNFLQVVVFYCRTSAPPAGKSKFI